MVLKSMSEQAFFVLSALVGKTLHGYGILREVAELSESRLSLRVGTLYGILDRMEANGLIEVDREVVVDSRLRRYYRLTVEGQDALTREIARQTRNAHMASVRLAALGGQAQ